MAKLAELLTFKDKTAPEVGRQSEMLMTQDHMCNIAIKQGLSSADKCLKRKNSKTGMIHLIKSADDVIEFNEASMTTLIEQNKINPETPEQRAIREKENAETVKRCKEKIERKKYNELTGKIAGFQNQLDLEERHAK